MRGSRSLALAGLVGAIIFLLGSAALLVCRSGFTVKLSGTEWTHTASDTAGAPTEAVASSNHVGQSLLHE